MGIWTPGEEEAPTCAYCCGLILSDDYVLADDGAIYCNKECELEAAKDERRGEWVSL